VFFVITVELILLLHPWEYMKTGLWLVGLQTLVAALLLGGCATSGPKQSASAAPERSTAAEQTGERQANKFRATDGRTIEIGKATPVNGGRSFKNPHLDKCWVADGFTFTGYDTLLIASIVCTAKLKDDEHDRLQFAGQQLPIKLIQFLQPKGLFTDIVMDESQIKPGARVLKFQNTIIDYSKGSGAARYFAGLYGAGQPMIRVEGKLLDGDKELFTYEARRSGTSFGARMGGASIGGEQIQAEDVHSMMLDLTDFMAAIAGKYMAKN
jgi:hypothetical protein